MRKKIAFLFLIISTPLTAHSKVVSGVDQAFKIKRYMQVKEMVSGRSEGVHFYQKVLSKTLGSSCDMYPNDSKYAQINFSKCSAIYSIINSMHRFYLEPDSATVGLDIIATKKVFHVDLPRNCRWH
ncbi:MAG: hypothetical protein A2504_04845 [Bdellovibrionales bacterium RIFOXYD12_FULL_39_22]|nr:MAG: hypothetical protein A2385_06980 [Bdellovibrionales bacterium RIFOXYB1_FULL_39_21]OFZ42008.1 MAG: hypothetical protein A2485_08950 [Bdellovibrionales bacterium RIFOXYC12_FULL_39_17]OFZ50724.1 MAG: hypothetical protein A2404_05900 [Bdellovibrionales bacterium RIFOXYC1_FULL_39_130]OFZ77947.1 MAG: hypothetical protein A2560_01070 [Bdellovibrionales bacterium RIFOXYD1_FULL_39_84]OFZ93617.1 MAG: hypothetical protein A2504_04845 [Bdellovibrionales bacterium RIFOXYD12_FULL_39_22]HLE10257.1 hy